MTELFEVGVDRGSIKCVTVNGDRLTTNIGPEKLSRTLHIGREAILYAIQDAYERLKERKERDPDLTISPPPLFVVRFGTQAQAKRILAPKGLDNNTCVHKYMDELAWPYRPFWQAVNDEGFRPEVRSGLVDSQKEFSGIWLMLHAREPDIV